MGGVGVLTSGHTCDARFPSRRTEPEVASQAVPSTRRRSGPSRALHGMQETPTSPIPLRPPGLPRAERSDGATPKRKLKKLRLALVLLVLSVLALLSTVFGMMMAVSNELPQLENAAQFR